MENLNSIYKSFLQLVRLGIGTSKDAKISDDIDWAAMKALADKQGLTAIVLDGVGEKLKTNSQLSSLNSQLKLSWIGATELQRLQYEHSWKVACKLNKLWAAEGIQATVLKGRSIANTILCHRIATVVIWMCS